MQQTIEVIVHPDGRIEAHEPLTSSQPRHALLTILDEPVASSSVWAPGSDEETAQVEAALRAGGLLDTLDDVPPQLQPLSETARTALAASIPPGSSLSQIISDERAETF